MKTLKGVAKMDPKERDRTIRRYVQQLKRYGKCQKTLGWMKGRQKVRFAAALEGLTLQDFPSVADIGCGFGDLYDFMHDQGWKGHYCGVDIVPDLIEIARSTHTGHNNIDFRVVDILEERLDNKADLVMALGIFNNRTKGDHFQYIKDMLSVIWESSRNLVCVDFLSTTAASQREELFFADPAVMLSLAQKYSKRVQIHHSYMPFEFMVKIWRDDIFTTEHPVFSSYMQYIDDE